MKKEINIDALDKYRQPELTRAYAAEVLADVESFQDKTFGFLKALAEAGAGISQEQKRAFFKSIQANAKPLKFLDVKLYPIKDGEGRPFFERGTETFLANFVSVANLTLKDETFQLSDKGAEDDLVYLSKEWPRFYLMMSGALSLLSEEHPEVRAIFPRPAEVARAPAILPNEQPPQQLSI